MQNKAFQNAPISSGDEDTFAVAEFIANPNIFYIYREAAKALLQRRDVGAFYAVGQSLSFLVAAAQIEAEHSGDHRQFGYIAHSKNIMTLPDVRKADGKAVNNGFYALLPSLPDHPEHRVRIKTYRKYLRHQGLDPQSIIERHNQDRKTAFLDIAAGGGGIASFVWVVANEAEEIGIDPADIGRAVVVMGYCNKDTGLGLLGSLPVQLESGNKLCVACDWLAEGGDKGINPFANRAPRVVAVWPYEKWNERPQPVVATNVLRRFSQVYRIANGLI